MKMSKFEIFRPFLGAAAVAVALALLPVATYSTVVSDTLTADETKLTASDGAEPYTGSQTQATEGHADEVDILSVRSWQVQAADASLSGRTKVVRPPRAAHEVPGWRIVPVLATASANANSIQRA